jgi:periplasmic protein TonB
MKTKEKIENNLDEVIFEKRNKEYGAYFLRKTYDKNVSKALIITVLLLLFTVFIPLIAKYISDERYFRAGPDQDPGIIVLSDPINKIDPPPPPPPIPIADIENRVKFRVPKSVDTNVDLAPMLTQVELSEQKSNEPVEDFGLKVDADQKDKKVIDEDVNKIVDFAGVSEKPEFPGGQEALLKFVADNMKYPALALDNGIQGTVYIEFVIEADGSLTNIKVKKGIGAGCDEEAERVVNLMPKWTAGKQNNIGVRVRAVIPMKFRLMD